jgi:hypothetical protein
MLYKDPYIIHFTVSIANIIHSSQELTESVESPAARARQAELQFIQQQMTAAFMMDQLDQQRKQHELQQMRQQQMDKSMHAANPYMMQHFANAAAQQQMHDPGLLALLAQDRQAAERYHNIGISPLSPLSFHLQIHLCTDFKSR